MKRRMLCWAILPVLVFALTGVAQAWQGRMGGMGDPYGLISDESDFLIHPAKIAKGEGIRFYGDYQFTYWDMFDSDIDALNSGGPISLDLSGTEMKHDALLGAAFPLGSGRMGLFFTYEGRQGDYEGMFRIPATVALDLMSDLDAFALQILYGIPLGNFRLGGELGIAYRQEENKSIWGNNWVNWWYFFILSQYCVLPSFAPYDANYWEIPFKAGLEGTLGPVDLEFTVRGGWIVAGDNTMAYGEATSTIYDLDGDVEGWRVGGDLWVRYPLADDLSMPVLVRVDYQEKERDGDYRDAVYLHETDTKEQTLDITVGGGVDWEPAAGTRVGAGIYYSYLQQNTDFSWYITDFTNLMSFDHTDWPNATEHRGTLVLAGERELSPMVALRMGLSCFLGWATEDQRGIYFSTPLPAGPYYYLINYSMDGFHWGIGASIGATIRVAQFALEPFIKSGYQSLELSGDGSTVDFLGMGIAPLVRDESRNQWSIGGGLSILFDLP